MIPIPPQVAALAAGQGVRAVWRIAKVAVPVLMILGLTIALMITRSTLERRTEQRDALQGWQNAVVVAITDATVPPDASGRRARADPATVVTRIATLAENVRALFGAVRLQNAAIADAQAQGEQRLQKARSAAAEAARRNAAREVSRRALEAQGRTTGLTDAEWNQL